MANIEILTVDSYTGVTAKGITPVGITGGVVSESSGNSRGSKG